MNRITARNKNGLAYLVNVKPNEQEVESPYKNTLRCILDCFARLGDIEDTLYAPDGTELITIDRLRELVQAEKDGRLCVLPCKVGDIIAEDVLWDAPEIDAVPVVRCKDCEHYRAQLIVNTAPTAYVCCRTNGYSPGENHYCAWAEKSVLPKEQRYTAGCLAHYGDGIKVGKKEETT